MKKVLITVLFISIFFQLSKAQDNFNYSLQITPKSISNFPGLHSFAYAQYNNKWLIIGGRKDGMHARQPFNAFPSANNNTTMYVVDINTNQVWSSSVNILPISIAEQLQSSNMNFIQHEDTLYVIGGYAYSNTEADHITFPYLTTIKISETIQAIIQGQNISSFIKQLFDERFAICGGQAGIFGNEIIVVGGQRFDGRYNPMGNPTYVQTYTNEVRKYKINNAGSSPSILNYSTITDAIHLHRRDYNLLPQIFPSNRTFGYTISSGVFQPTVDLPYLYPVDIFENSINPINNFNQYLSNYHSAKTFLYDSINNQMHNIFFGGMSQYYYQNGTLLQDNLVPFVKTISRLSRYEDGSFLEFQLPIEMPALKGSSAEFIVNENLPRLQKEIIHLSQINQDSFIIGHIVGGIYSPSINPFSNNNTSTTSADNTVYEVKLVRNNNTGKIQIDGSNPYDISVSPNPTKINVNVKFKIDKKIQIQYFLHDIKGNILQKNIITDVKIGLNKCNINLPEINHEGVLYITFIFENKYFVTKKIVIQNKE